MGAQRSENRADGAAAEERAGDGGALHGAVLDTLGPRIAGGELPPGHVLTLDSIREEFGVSRTVAREAMRVLESMGLVTTRRRVGLTVQPPESWNVYDPRVIWWRLAGPGRDAQLRTLVELRLAVEPLAAGAAARNAPAAARERAVELAAALRERGEAGEAGARGAFLDLDVAFHTLLLEASGNEMFAALGDVVAVVLRGRTELGLMPHHPVPEALDLHQEVARAVRDGEAAAAERAMRELLAEVGGALPGARGGARGG